MEAGHKVDTSFKMCLCLFRRSGINIRPTCLGIPVCCKILVLDQVTAFGQPSRLCQHSDIFFFFFFFQELHSNNVRSSSGCFSVV